MSGRRAKADRRLVADVKRQALDELRHPVNTALVNTDDLNNRLSDVEAWAQVFSNLTFRQRFRWLLKGE